MHVTFPNPNPLLSVYTYKETCLFQLSQTIFITNPNPNPSILPNPNPNPFLNPNPYMLLFLTLTLCSQFTHTKKLVYSSCLKLYWLANISKVFKQNLGWNPDNFEMFWLPQTLSQHELIFSWDAKNNISTLTHIYYPTLTLTLYPTLTHMSCFSQP